jgi:hypothetical protein
MIRDFLMASVAAIAMTGSAVAADLPSRKAPPVAYVPPPPVFSWTGFYVGVNARFSRLGRLPTKQRRLPFWHPRTISVITTASALLAAVRSATIGSSPHLL